MSVQCLTQELKKVRHMSHQAEKGETYVSPGETHDIIILKLANQFARLLCKFAWLPGMHYQLPFMISKYLLQSQ